MTERNKIEGIIRLITPLHCASGDKTTDDSMPNLTRTHKTYLMTARGNQAIPYFPGNDSRGRLRRKEGPGQVHRQHGYRRQPRIGCDD